MKKTNSFSGFLLVLLSCCAFNLVAQTYNDGPIELQIRVTAVRVDYDTFSSQSNDFNLSGSIVGVLGGITPVPGLQADEITCKVWARDNMGSAWQGGDCIQADLPMSVGGPEVYAVANPVVIFSHTYTTQQVPQFFDLKLQAWEDDVSADFDQLPSGVPFILTNDCQSADGFSRCVYDGTSTDCFTLFGPIFPEMDDIYYDCDPFKINLDYRAAGSPGQWNSHGFIAGNCPSNNFYQVQVESFYRFFDTDSVSGKITSEMGCAVQSATLKANGTGTAQITTTGVGGDYTIILDAGASYNVVPSKSNDITAGNGVSSFDILMMRRHVLGTPLASPYRIIAADVNSSGSVSTTDILLVRSMILQTITVFPGNKLWAFVLHDFAFGDSTNPFPHDTSRYYASVSSMGDQDFIGMKLGDVNNSWDPNIQKNDTYAGKIILEIPEIEALAGEEVELPLIAKNFDDVSGLQFTVRWNPAQMKLRAVEKGSLAVDYNMQKWDEGKMSVLWTEENAKSITLMEGDELFRLKFLMTGMDNIKATLEINSDLTPVEAVNGNLELLEVESVKKEIARQTNVSDEYEVKHFPNPFRDASIVAFTLPVEANIQLQIFNVVGKQVKEYAGNYAAGNHQLIIDLSEMASGSYFVKFRSGAFEKNFKIVGF